MTPNSAVLLLAVLLAALVHVARTQVEKADVEESHRRYAELMKHDGTKRVKVIDSSAFKKLLKKNEIIVVYFWIDNQKETEKLSEQDVLFLETVAQSMEGKKTLIGTCEIMKNQKFAVASEVKYTGMIKIFNHGKVQTYSGQRSPDVLIPYLYKMLTPSVVELKKKAEKKNYEAIDLVKVVAYLSKGSKEHQAFIEASYTFQPMIPFYLITDAKLAKAFHLKKLNSIQLVKPYEKSVNFPSKDKIDFASILKFIKDNKKERLTKMRLENLHEIWAIDLKGYLVPLFANVKTEEGATFFAKTKKLSKSFETNSNLSFVWIEPEPFPAMIEYWRKSFEIDPLKPNIGVVDIHTQKSVWFERVEGEGEKFSVDAMRRWINAVLKGDVELKPMKTMEDLVDGEQKNKAKEEERDEEGADAEERDEL